MEIMTTKKRITKIIFIALLLRRGGSSSFLIFIKLAINAQAVIRLAKTKSTLANRIGKKGLNKTATINISHIQALFFRSLA